MSKPKPPKPKPKPKCPPHRLKFPATDDNGTYTHQCKKCGTKWTKPKGGKPKADGVGWGCRMIVGCPYCDFHVPYDHAGKAIMDAHIRQEHPEPKGGKK